ncbi:histidine kinase [Kordiimonas lipolytica]|uniref:Histidine kinase n=1 Tax=Kordiimonas lipolytica TaxID=1662421 RepID=A0ABV8U5E6_9PROT|nr:histidine kinase [Kordiimonas lipolytica]
MRRWRLCGGKSRRLGYGLSMKRFLTYLVVLWVACSPTALAVELEAVAPPMQFVPTVDKPLPGPEDWKPFTGRVPHKDATLVFRQEILVRDGPEEAVTNPLAMSVSLYGVYDFYWDGALIGSNRQRGESANRHSRVMIPAGALEPGKHLLEMRINALGLEKGAGLDLYVRTAALQSDFFGVHWSVISTFFVATASFLVGGYLLVLTFTGGRSPTLLAAAVTCFAIFAVILLEEGQFLFSYPYGWQPLLDRMIVPFALLVFALLAWVTLVRLGLKNRALWMGAAGLALALALVAAPDGREDIWAFAALQLLLMGAAALAAYRGRTAPGLYFWGHGMALAALAVDPLGKHPYLIAVTLLLAIDLGLDLRRRTREAQQLALVSERLRADLIKRNIQPHFLMNSLTALMEWVETSPEDAVDFIDGLATEFRLLADFAERQSVTLREELDLCRVHLRLMEQRFEARMTIETTGVDLQANVPPGILHTLMENAFTHNNYTGRDICFRLMAEELASGTRYHLRCPVTAGAVGTGLGTGTGTRYVIARLEEFCGKAFRFDARQVGSAWETIIEIGRKNEKGGTR